MKMRCLMGCFSPTRDIFARIFWTEATVLPLVTSRHGGIGLVHKVTPTRGPRYMSPLACDIACFSISTEGTFLSRPDSSWYILQVMPGEFEPGKTSFPSIQMEGDPLMFLLTASS